MTRQLKSLAFAAALSALAGAAAHAQTIDRVTQSQSVFYADLNLSTEGGMKTLITRIHGAAKNVCGPEPDSREWQTSYQACIKAASDSALVQVARAAGSSQMAVNVQRRHGG